MNMTDMINVTNMAKLAVHSLSESGDQEVVESQFLPVLGFISMVVAAACCGLRCCGDNGRGHRVQP